MTGLAGLDEIARLSPDWDSYGAPPIKPEVIEEARRWILALAAHGEPKVSPVSDGSILLMWAAPQNGLTGDVWVGP